MKGRVRDRAPDEAWSVMKCARVWDEIWQQQPLLFLSFRECRLWRHCAAAALVTPVGARLNKD